MDCFYALRHCTFSVAVAVKLCILVIYILHAQNSLISTQWWSCSLNSHSSATENANIVLWNYCVRAHFFWHTSKILLSDVFFMCKLLVVYANNRNFASSKQGNREATSKDNTIWRYWKFERIKVNRLSGNSSIEKVED